jgi:stage III sporulation protein AA
MLIVNNTHRIIQTGLFNYLPNKIRNVMYRTQTEGLEEIRLRRGQPLMLCYAEGNFFVTENGMLRTADKGAVRVGKSDMDEALELITEASVYAVEDELRQGFITVNGGHRVGVCGRAVTENGQVRLIKDISGLNYRISHEIYTAADSIIESVYNGGYIRNTLIISPPQCGKTTILRDLSRRLSEKNVKVGIVDERGEIAAMSRGMSGYDIGYSDVLDFCPKKEGMMMMLRSMSPEVIVTDEIGAKGDAEVVCELIKSGVKVITSIHSRTRADAAAKTDTDLTLFDCLVTLSRRKGVGTVEEIYCGG